MTHKPAPVSDYLPQLDALRCLAVFGVLVAHLWHPRRLPGLLGNLDGAGPGVRLFFVLSGFLITGILLSCKEMAEADLRPPTKFIFRFYARRFLRILPIYYLVLFVTLLVDVWPARELWAWLSTFTTNIHITLYNTWPGRFGHFWTLAVEEQFYLVWPWLVLLLPRKWLTVVVLLCIPLASLYRYYAFYAFPFDIGAQDFKAGTLTIANLDTLGVGALLAIVWRSRARRARLQKVLTWIVLPAGAVIYVGVLYLYTYGLHPMPLFVFSDLGAAMMFTWLVSSASLGFGGWPGRLLEARPLRYLGKISYGIYVYHNFAPLIMVPLMDRLGLPYTVPSFRNFLAAGSLTILVAALSWHFIERPINRLKRHFEYAEVQPAPLPPAERRPAEA